MCGTGIHDGVHHGKLISKIEDDFDTVVYKWHLWDLHDQKSKNLDG